MRVRVGRFRQCSQCRLKLVRKAMVKVINCCLLKGLLSKTSANMSRDAKMWNVFYIILSGLLKVAFDTSLVHAKEKENAVKITLNGLTFWNMQVQISVMIFSATNLSNANLLNKSNLSKFKTLLLSQRRLLRMQKAKAQVRM